MNKFQVGDKVVAVEKTYKFDIGDIGHVVYIYSTGYIDVKIDGVTQNSSGRDVEGGGWMPQRFKLVKEEQVSVEATIDFSKPVRTKDGFSVEIVTTEGRDKDFPVVAYIGDEDSLNFFTKEGKYFSRGDDNRDLENVPEPKNELVGYFNIYKNTTSGIDDIGGRHNSRESADKVAANTPGTRVGCKRVVFVEGEFDE